MSDEENESAFTLDGGLKNEYERSKFLGGDEEHTHLVKGLDYALLARERKTIEEQNLAKSKKANDAS